LWRAATAAKLLRDESDEINEVLAVTWPGVRRAVGLSGGPSPASKPTAAVAAGLRLGQPERHPAMIGINISPVHGWHCSCRRCIAQLPAAV
jgi:hypothetical protein